jgi:O-antigen/teichoic acid export membrane protein
LIGVVFGPEYAGAAVVLRILSASFALKFILVAFQTVLTTRDRHAWRTGALAVATAGAGIGHLLLIPSFGAAGAAGTVVAAEGFLLLLYLWGLGEPRLRVTLAKRVLGVCVAAGVAALALGLTGLEGPSAALVAMAAAAAGLAGVGFVRPSELGELWRGLVGGSAGTTGGPG